jgi:DNA-binding FrmR family transcriptional regulator
MKKKQRSEYAGIDASDEIKRLNRVIGQVEGVRKMLEEERKLEDILMQCKAVHSALRAVEHRLVKAHLETALNDIVNMDKKKTRQQKISELEALYKHSA